MAEKLLEIFKERDGKDKINRFNIVAPELRDSLNKSYNVGKLLRDYDGFKLEDLPLKIAIWDYIAGMTDSFIVKEYESLTFKKINLD